MSSQSLSRLTQALWSLAGLFFAAMLLGSPAVAHSQAGGVNQAGPEYIHGNVTNDPLPQHGNADGSNKLEQMRRAEMHRLLLADAARLQQLSTELKAELDRTSPDQLSVSAVRKAGEIEKLARNVKAALSH